MPQINRIRVNNVKYNFGTQFYDDFLMRFSCKNTIYDLANGGGKSVLMLLLLQNMLPNCTLDEKQPIEKLFRAGNDNTVIHSLVEWKLNPCHIKNGFQYMTTGFCARKAKESGAEGVPDRNTAPIDYFNYCIFYREFNDNDIRNLPLSSGTERITYQGLKNYLRDLEKKDFNLQIHLFERKGEYQQFVADYGIYESEWELIRGINKTEGHVRTYFETNYRTTRKVVEDLLIQEIIQKAFYTKTERSGDEEQTAKTLMDIKDKLVELAQKKGEIANYDRQMEILEGFIQWMNTLKDIYQKKEDLKEELLAVYRTCVKRRKDKEEARDQLEQRREEAGARKRQLMKEAETAAVQLDKQSLEELHKETEKCRETVTSLEEELEHWKEKQRECENTNDYLDYLEAEAGYASTQISLENVHKQNEELAGELYTLAGQIKILMEESGHTLREQLSEEETHLTDRREELEKALAEERKTDRMIAVLEERIRELEAEKERLSEAAARCQQETGLLLLSEAPKRLGENIERQKEWNIRLESLAQEKAETDEQYTGIRISMADDKTREQLMTDRLEECQRKLRQCREEKEHAERLQKAYQESDMEKLRQLLSDSYESSCGSLQELRVSLAAKQKQLRGLRQNRPLLPSGQIMEWKDYIERVHDTTVRLGCEYLEELDPVRREEALELNPLLPYALLVEKGAEQIAENHSLQEKISGDRLVPILSMQAVQEGIRVAAGQQVAFLTQDPSLYYDAETIEKKINRLRQEIESDEKKRLRLEEQIAVVRQDRDYLQQALSREDYREQQEKYRQISQELQELRAQSELRLGEKERLNGRREQLDTLKAQILEQLEEALREERQLQETVEAVTALKEAEGQLAETKKNLEEKQQTLTMLRKQISGQQEAVTDAQDQIRRLQSAIRRMEEEWEQAYASYDRAVDVAPPDQELRELAIQFQGKKQALDQESSDVADKEQLARSYRAAMEKCVTSLRYRGTALDAMKERFRLGTASRTKEEELWEIRKRVTTLEEQIRVSRHHLESRMSRYHQEMGSVDHAQKSVEKKYGAYDPLEGSREELTALVKENQLLISRLEEELAKDAGLQKELISQCYALEAMQNDMEQMMKTEEINGNSEGPLLEEGTSLKDSYQKLRSQYTKISREEAAQREEFLKEKNKLAETLEATGAFDLAREIKQSVESPSGAEDVKRQSENINRTIACIALEKERVDKGLEDMDKLRINFENQCLQSCLNIKEELDRLPKLSKINLDGQPVSILTLQIPYIKEESYHQAMTDYIGSIVERADTIQNPTEQLRYIRSHLAWKKLFSVIVTDMDAIRLMLYKRERMKEQSRYLRYEEAVGSTGQSQGIYIQFLVAVVNYITSIYAGSTDPVGLRKVIFIDNPFGAAKDIYIWEPIFQLLKNNHVQLIVPARGATPAITGRFEVNYILGQKFIGGRQQTVVVDYRSQTEEREMDYIPITYEQPELSFE